MRLLLRIMRLALGFWSPSLIMAIEGRRMGESLIAGLEGAEPQPVRLTWLDRWELRNHRRDCERLGRDPMAPTGELANNLELGARMMRGEKP